MNKTKVSIKAIFKYLSTIITWSIFVILFCCAAFLVYYFVSLQLYSSKGSSYQPNFSIYTIVSPSMTPKIKVYDVIINTKVNKPSDIKVGDVITFKSTSAFTYDMTITHRVVDIQIVNGEYQFITKGDNNAVADSAPALYANVIGIARVKIPQLGRAQVFIASKTGWLFVVVIPALFIIIKDIVKLVKVNSIKGTAKKTNNKVIKSES